MIFLFTSMFAFINKSSLPVRLGIPGGYIALLLRFSFSTQFGLSDIEIKMIALFMFALCLFDERSVISIAIVWISSHWSLHSIFFFDLCHEPKMLLQFPCSKFVNSLVSRTFCKRYISILWWETKKSRESVSNRYYNNILNSDSY